jgi:hypothetical protein
MFGDELKELMFQIIEILISEEQTAVHKHHRASNNRCPKSRPMGAGVAIGLCGGRKDGWLFSIGISLNCINMEGTPVTCLVCTML